MAFRDGEYLIDDGQGTYGRDNLVAAAAIAGGSGTVIGKVTANGKFKAWDPTAEDGSQVVAGICHRNGVKLNDRFRGTTRRAEVKAARLVYPAGQLAAATAGLKAIGIIVR